MSFPTLQDHRKHIHEVHSKEYHPCPTCGKIFSAPSMLERHMVTHVGGKPFSCGICNKAYQVSLAPTGACPARPPSRPSLWSPSAPQGWRLVGHPLSPGYDRAAGSHKECSS